MYYEPPRPEKKKKRGCLIFILAVLVLIGVLTYVLVMDEGLKPDDELAFDYKPVPAEENGYDEVASVQLEMKEEEQAAFVKLGREWDKEKAKAVVAENPDVVESIRDALKKPRIQVPKVIRVSDLSAEYHESFDDASRILYFHSRILYEEGEPELALAHATMMVLFGCHLERADGPTLLYYLGGQFKDTGLRLIRNIVLYGKIPAETLKATLVELEKAEEDVNALKKSLKLDFFICKLIALNIELEMKRQEKLKEIPEGVLKLPGIYKMNATINRFRDYFTTLVEDADKPYCDRRKIDWEESSLSEMILTFNVVGELVFIVGTTVVDTFLEDRPRLNARLGATRLLLACQIYKQANGEMPKTLDALVPEYLPELPTDPYSRDGAPFRYSHKRKLVYCVGEEGEDQGGMTRADLNTAIHCYYRRGLWDKDVWLAPNPSFPVDAMRTRRPPQSRTQRRTTPARTRRSSSRTKQPGKPQKVPSAPTRNSAR